jgi:PBP1b-binding outer membrane lipoprotein LpoB
MHDLKVKACSLNDEVEKTRKVIIIDSAKNRINGDLRMLRLKQNLKNII